jgi:hypothetical protein
MNDLELKLRKAPLHLKEKIKSHGTAHPIQ